MLRDNVKAPFTAVQLVLTVINLFLFVGTAVGDIFILLLESGEFRTSTYVTNLLLCLLGLVVSTALTFRPSIVNTFGDENEGGADRIPAVSALRTYFCMIFLDVGGVLALMYLGTLILDNAMVIILIFAPILFILSAVIYFMRVSRLGLVDFSDDENEKADDEEDL